ncbi:hypothetical protein HT749_01340 [Burkholderia cepacia]|uniref:hypothetical protein n=1 Tax=Burkholderia cepacia TaxID=292 RepID=UPI00157A2817|nr:hypothetical protein [Burkholderia cepacia]NTX42041.1 hypothetical protein [Burkholderia cepacia]
MMIRNFRNSVPPVLLLTGLAFIHSGHAEEAPRSELGCRVLDAEGYPLGTQDLTFQQRLQMTRCMNAAERSREAESKRQKSQLQTIENTKIARRVYGELFPHPGDPPPPPAIFLGR